MPHYSGSAFRTLERLDEFQLMNPAYSAEARGSQALNPHVPTHIYLDGSFPCKDIIYRYLYPGSFFFCRIGHYDALCTKLCDGRALSMETNEVVHFEPDETVSFINKRDIFITPMQTQFRSIYDVLPGTHVRVGPRFYIFLETEEHTAILLDYFTGSTLSYDNPDIRCIYSMSIRYSPRA